MLISSKMSRYQILNNLIFSCNRKRYSRLPYAWNKVATIKHLLEKIPELKTSFLKEVKNIHDIGPLTEFALKSTFGHSAREVFILKRVSDGSYYDIVRKKKYSVTHIMKLILKLKQPFIEKRLGTKFVPYDIKVHIFFGRLCFFYIYNKGYNNQYSKARYDKNLRYIQYNKMFFQGAFKDYSHFKENGNIIKSVNLESLKQILFYSVKIFEQLDNLVYCSVDWLYDPLSGEYAFCELTPTPFVLSKPIKTAFIQTYISNK